MYFSFSKFFKDWRFFFTTLKNGFMSAPVIFLEKLEILSVKCVRVEDKQIVGLIFLSYMFWSLSFVIGSGFFKTLLNSYCGVLWKQITSSFHQLFSRKASSWIFYTVLEINDKMSGKVEFLLSKPYLPPTSRFDIFQNNLLGHFGMSLKMGISEISVYRISNASNLYLFERISAAQSLRHWFLRKVSPSQSLRNMPKTTSHSGKQ